MKKIFTLLLFIGFATSGYTQCVQTLTTNPVTCDTSCNAVVSVQFSGGVLPLSIQLNFNGVPIGNFSTPTLSWQHGNLCPGSYEMIVVDAAGDTCTGQTFFTITVGATFTVQVNVVNATCAGCCDGAATVVVTGGNPPYSYQWSNGSTAPTLIGLCIGMYTVYIVDANGCMVVQTFMIGVGLTGNYYTITGSVYFDTNSNGVKDVGEVGLGNQVIEAQPGNIQAMTISGGDYAFVTDTGSFAVSYVGAPGWNLTSTPATYNVNVDSTSVTGLEFGVFPDSTIGSASLTLISGIPRCLWTVPYMPILINNGLTVLDGTMIFTYDPQLTFYSSSVTPFSHIGNVITYTYTGLAPGNYFQPIIQLTEPVAPATINSTVSATGTDVFGYQFALNYSLPQTVSCSYDPNDKAVFPEGYGLNHFVTLNTPLDYMIRFQNTGNDTAFNVVIVDTISNALDLSTLIVTGSSHPVAVNIRPGREVSFTFSNILLPDSNVNEPASHGFVSYRINGLSTNPDPTPVNNTAHIYFDSNSPIQTNTTLTTFSDNFLGLNDVSGNNNLFSVYPNPMSNGAILKYSGEGNEEFEVQVMDLSGRIIKDHQILSKGNLIITNENLSAGTYLIRINSDEPVYLRLVVQ